MCFSLPSGMAPSKHMNNFSTHPVPGQSRKFVYVYVFCLSLITVTELGPFWVHFELLWQQFRCQWYLPPLPSSLFISSIATAEVRIHERDGRLILEAGKKELVPSCMPPSCDLGEGGGFPAALLLPLSPCRSERTADAAMALRLCFYSDANDR